MASLKLEHIYKVYPNGTKAVNDISLDIKDGEFIVFVGPSGCGKSTTLRMIAGLEEITAGELYIDSDIVNDMEPKDRDIAMVFQNYALYPHMTVYENMAFGLKLRHIPDDVIQERVLWAADILGLKEYLDRKPRNMSGGQRQRVSLGRAILRNPKVMLLDEPLSNLDAKLRTQMRTEIAKLHQRLKTTFIYVTHDQTEAMTLGNRVVVMKGGRIQQVDTPKNLYNYPNNKFVAGFIGTPQMNFLSVTMKRDGERVDVHLHRNDQHLYADYNSLVKVAPSYLDGEHKITMGVRCEHVKIGDKHDDNAIRAKVSHYEELGSEALIYCNLSEDEKIDSCDQIIAKVNEIGKLLPGDEVALSLDLDSLYFFDDETENTILPRIPEVNVLDASISRGNLMVLGSSLRLPDAIQSADLENVQVEVPNDAFIFGQAGISAKVLKVEQIGDVYLAHLMANNRVFFAKANPLAYPIVEGNQIEIAIDFAKVRATCEGTEVFAPIAKMDTFGASFYNYQTVIQKADNPEFAAHHDNKVAEVAEMMDKKIREEEEKYQNIIASLQYRNAEHEIAVAKTELDRIADENSAAICEKKAESKKKIAELTAAFKEDKRVAKENNDKLFREKKAKEEEEYRQFKSVNSDKESLKRRTDEYHIFKDNFDADKENTLNLKINSLTLDYEAKVASLKAETKRLVTNYKKEIQEARANYNKTRNYEKNVRMEHEKKMRELQAEKKIALERAELLFFFYFSGDYYSIATDVIANKLIQGLGTRVFSRSFKIEMPHDAYIESNSANAFEVLVESNLDYGSVYYVRCKYTDANGDDQFLFIQSDQEKTVGEKIRLDFDISRSQITETAMNIRLY